MKKVVLGLRINLLVVRCVDISPYFENRQIQIIGTVQTWERMHGQERTYEIVFTETPHFRGRATLKRRYLNIRIFEPKF